MRDDQTDETLIKILEEDRKASRRKKGPGNLLVRLLIIAALLFVGFYGFILFRQYRLNLEAQAIIYARQTLQAGDENGQSGQEDAEADIESLVETTPAPQADEAASDESLPTPSLIE